MDAYMIILRLIHIFAGIFWVGATFFMVGFVEPTVRASGPVGGQVMQKLMSGTRFSVAVAAAGGLTMLSGLLLYWRISNGLTTAVMFGSRLPLTLGAISGILAGVLGGGIQGRASARLAALGQQMAAGGTPDPAHLAEMQKLQETIRQGSAVTAVLMALAVIGMAV